MTCVSKRIYIYVENQIIFSEIYLYAEESNFTGKELVSNIELKFSLV